MISNGAAPSCDGINLLVAEGDDGGFGYNYGNPTWSDMTAAIDNAAAAVTVTPNLADLNFMLQFDALWVDQRWISGTLTAAELANVEAYIATGRRVVMIGESASWSTWNSQILGLAGGSYSGREISGGLINTATFNALTDGVSQIDTEFDGLADGGTPLFDQDLVTLWGTNVLTILTINGMGQLWNSSDNAAFFTNVANWIGCNATASPEVFEDFFESGDVCSWDTIVPAGPFLSFATADVVVNETAGTAAVTVQRIDSCGGPVNALSVRCETSDGTASAGSDYTATSEVLNWAVGDTAPKQCTVPISADALAEGDETVNLALADATGGAAIGGLGTAVLTIQDSPGELSFTASSFLVNEIDGTASITVSRAGGLGGAVSVDCTTADGTAVAPGDYTATTDTLNWADGDAADKICTVPVVNDGVLEGDETVNLSLANTTGGATLGTPNTATLTIEDSPGELSYTASSFMVNEIDGTASITVRRTGGQNGAVSADCTTADGTAVAPGDYTATTETLNWADGDTADKICTVPVVADGTLESDETVNLSLTNLTGGAILGTPSTATLTIKDPGEVSFTASSFTVNETDGTASITVERTGGAGGAVSVRCDTADGTATAGSDYTATMETLNWADGDAADKTCTVPVADEGTPEGDETVILSLTNVVGAALGAKDLATLTIEDSPGVLSFTTAGFTVSEGDGTASITVQRAGGQGGAVSVDCATADNTATAGSDYTATTDTLNWADGDTADKTCTVPILEDALIETDETVDLSLTNVTGGASLGAPSTATLTIEDAAGEVAFSMSNFSVNEADGTASITVERTGGSGGAASVRCDTADATATAPGDYTATMDTLNWADGDTADKTCTVPVIDDGLVESDETVILSLTNVTGAALGPKDIAILTIEDAPAGSLSFVTSNHQVDERDGSASIEVQRTGGSNGAVSVRCESADGTAKAADMDYAATMETLHWTAGDTANKACTVAILNDSSLEKGETVRLRLADPTGGATLGDLNFANLTMIIDDEYAGDLSFLRSSYQVDERDGIASIEVQRTSGSGGTVSALCGIADGSATAWDYTPTMQTVTWADGDNTNKTCSIPITDDFDVEGGETLNLSLADVTGAALVAPSAVVLTIVDDDDPGEVSFTAPVYRVGEGAGIVEIGVRRTGGSAGVVSVRCQTAAGRFTNGAVELGDYKVAMQVVTWADGDNSDKACLIPIVKGSATQGGGSLALSLTDVTGGATVGTQGTATLTINDNM